jgi:hypothetical protein
MFRRISRLPGDIGAGRGMDLVSQSIAGLFVRTGIVGAAG